MRYAVFYAVAALGCAADSGPAGPLLEPIDRGGGVTAIELSVEPEANFAALREQELSFQGPEIDPTGQQYITVVTTGQHAASLEEFGFRIRGKTRLARRDDTGRVTSLEELSCSTPTDSDYFRSYADIVAELEAMDAVSDYVTVTDLSLGIETLDGNKITAVKFGPLEEGNPNPPTLYILATYHAREWMTTAVALQLSRWLFEVITTNKVDGIPEYQLGAGLAQSSIVIVPVVNPDGYEYSRAAPANRNWRGNRNVVDCPSGGVDLNRNHSTAWDGPAPGTSDNCSFAGTWRGPYEASEIETAQIEILLSGAEFGGQVPIGLISYHSYADMVVYADGWGNGCDLDYDNNCFNPDFTLLRDLFGDTHSNLFYDGSTPYLRDHSRTLLYGVSGDTNLHATYGPVPMPAITPELPNNDYGFAIECNPSADQIVQETAADQLNVVRRVMLRAQALASTDPSTAYGPSAVGTMTPGLWTREYQDDPESARATFVKSIFKEASAGSMTATIAGQDYDFDFGRTGAQYDLYRLSPYGEEFGSLCLPCEIVSHSGEYEGTDTAIECQGCVDLCDPGRLWGQGWELIADQRGGSDDCWWSPNEEGAELFVPGGATPRVDTTHCHMTFSAEWGSLTGNQIIVERETSGGGWEPVLVGSYSSPYNDDFFPSSRMVSYAFEANNMISSGGVPWFRFRVENGVPSDVRIFDPVIYCRSGDLP